ncbi:hypothetical protein Dred_2591 [Desulforamulus reducens MI-1]|uniref:Uncharacterized protein n=1 Tax=Desulforamulus reducens (strain ATCC BAA-1160 / DSM 100696 / MI-1) TaxID=349161 RepID=A4J7P8_DESRM|nr:hypothetical protein [Desulforamulus reducens]ABO51101.1 hypothetical protein Dred_2591 [Desulforamulus reducens MI-1]
MGESDVQSIREDLREVKKALSELTAAMADLRVQVAGNYVTKVDFLKCQECAEKRIVKLHDRIEQHELQDKADRWKLAGLVATVTGIVLSVIQWIASLYRSGGQS